MKTRLFLKISSGFLLISRLAASGQVQQVWVSYAFPQRSEPKALVLDNAGRVIVAGTIVANDYGTATFDANGIALWQQRYSAAPMSGDNAAGAVVDRAGNIYVTGGSSVEGEPGEDFATVKYGPDGTELWVRRYHGPERSGGHATAITVDGMDQIYVTGVSGGPGSGSDFTTIKYAPDGTELWVARFDGPAHREDHAVAVAVDGVGNVFVSGGSSSAAAGFDFVTVKYAPDGTELWSARLDGGERLDDWPAAVAVTPDGGAAVTGRSQRGPVGYGARYDFVTVKYDAGGQEVWRARYRSPDATDNDVKGLAVDAAGNVIIAGTVCGICDYLAVKYDAAGNELWVARQSVGDRADDYLRGLTLDGAGNLYLTGMAYGNDGTSRRFVTAKLDPAGQRLWVAEFVGTGAFDTTTGVAVDGLGGVYVAGSSRYFEGAGGYVVVKYAQEAVPGLPAITVPPQHKSVPGGSDSTFSVSATGSPPLSYQWRYQGLTIPDATNATLALTNLQFWQRGDYSVIVSNALGSTVSSEAHLVVVVPPFLTRSPTDQFAYVGTTVSFALEADGTASLSFQWRQDGLPLAGATNATLVLTNLPQAAAGNYDAIVSNVAGAVTSAVVRLTVAAQLRQLWARREATPGATSEPFLKVDAAGNSYLAGVAYHLSASEDLLAHKYDPQGDLLWTVVYDSGPGRSDSLMASALDSLGNVYLAGSSSTAEGVADFQVVKYSSAGALSWASTYSGAELGFEAVTAVAVSSAGEVYLAGESLGQVATVKFSPTGQLLWDRRYDRGGSVENFNVALVVDADGNAYVASAVNDAASGSDLIVLKYSRAGNETWAVRFDGGAGDVAVALALDGAQGLYVCGGGGGSSECGSGSGSDFVIAKFARDDGRWIWTARFDNEGAEETPSALAVDGAGLVYVTGESARRNSYRWSAVTVGFDAAGSQRWVAIEPSSGRGGSRALALDSSGSVYLNFTLVQDGRGGFNTLKYDSAGNLLWKAFYTPGDNPEHFASGVGVDNAGNVYAAGQAYASPVGDSDFAIVKYQQNTVTGAPLILSPPRDQFVAPDATATFSVVASGTAPLDYQWRFNGIELSGADGSTLVLTNVSSEHVGRYSVEVRNPLGRVRSADVRLSIVVPPVMVSQPEPQSTVVGGDASFAVGATSSSGPLTYQWRRQGQAIAGATNSTFVLTNGQPSDAGFYTVDVANNAGQLTSQGATLVVSQAAQACGLLTLPPGGRSPLIVSDASGDLYSAAMGEGITRRDHAGQVRWSASYPGLPVGMVLGPDGSVYVTGYSNGVTLFMPGQTNLLTARYHPNGNLLWSRLDVAGTPAFWQSSADYPLRLQVDNAGNAIVLDDALMKFAPNGERLWAVGCCGRSIDLGLDAAGNSYVAYMSGADVITAKFSPAGAPLWSVSRQDMMSLTADLAVDSAGHVYLASMPPWSSGGDIVTAKYDAQGKELWTVRHRGPTVGAYAKDEVAVDSAGYVYVGATRDQGAFTLKYDPAGQLLWATRDNDSSSGLEVVRGLTPDDAGGLFVTVSAPGATGSDLVTLRYDAAGTRLWAARKTGPLGDFSRIAVQAPGISGDIHVSTVVESGPTILRYCPTDTEGLPAIVVAPRTQSVVDGTPVTFAVSATGAAPLAYQWLRNGLRIEGATTSTFTLSSASPSDIGEYAVEVLNALGSVISSSATLEVRVPPAFARAPLSQCVLSGTDVRFQTETAGDRPQTYQWSRNAIPIPGATNTLLHLSNAQPAQSGLYSIVASNWGGTATASAELLVSGRGQQEWVQTFTGPEDWYDVVAASALDSAGNIYVTGRSATDADSDYDIVTRKYDTTGAVLWERRYINTNSPARFANASDLEVDSAGNVYVVGTTYSPFLAYLTLKYDAAGALLWERRHTAGFHDSATAVAVDHTGNVIVTGASQDASLLADYLTVKYDSNGNFLWEVRHDGPAGMRDMAWDVAVDDANNIHVTGEVQTSSNPTGVATRDWATVRYTPAGVEQWVRRLDGGVNTESSRPALAVDPSGHVHVTGLYFTNSVADALVVKYDPAGRELWSFRYDSPVHGEDRAADLALDGAGNVYVTGFSQIGSYDGLTLKLDPDGRQLWEARYRQPGKSLRPRALSLGPAGHVIITAESTPSDVSYRDIVTVKYDPEGNQLWAAMDSGRRQISGLAEEAVDVHADAAGNVFVTGSIVDNGVDYLVLKYSSAIVAGAPTITAPPLSQAVTPGATVTLAVLATGDAPLQYQWRFNGDPIPGATGATLLLSLVSSANAGTYSVNVRNGLDCTQSSEAMLTLQQPAPPHLSGLRQLPDGRFALRLSGESGFTYVLENSADLQVWTPVLQLYNVIGVIDFVDPDPNPRAQRFYRAIKLGAE